MSIEDLKIGPGSGYRTKALPDPTTRRDLRPGTETTVKLTAAMFCIVQDDYLPVTALHVTPWITAWLLEHNVENVDGLWQRSGRLSCEPARNGAVYAGAAYGDMSVSRYHVQMDSGSQDVKLRSIADART